MIAVPKLTITVATVQDAALLTELSVTTFCDTFAKDNKAEDMDRYVAEEVNIEKLSAELSERDNIFFIARYDLLPVGYAKIRNCKIPEELQAQKPIELERLYVLHAYQDKKVGAAIMQRCLEHAIKNNHDVMWLGVWEHNYRALTFYKKWGFELFGSHDFVLGSDVQTDVLMKKEL